jgi:acrylyl-CoA reductase (NADPH)
MNQPLPPTGPFRCYLVTKNAEGKVAAEIAQRSLTDLPPGDVLIRVAYSSLNYKDAMAATGHPGVNKVFPHVPGVDASGVVVQSGAYEFVPGDSVLVTGFDVGADRWGGWAEYIRVPAEWVVRLPRGLTLRETMMLGTAGFTAGLCVDALQKHGVMPDGGEVIVTGASGGVGSMAVAILGKLGYHVAAATGKIEAHEYLKSIGAREVIHRHGLDDHSGRPMLTRRWAGGVDTVGGNILGTVLRAAQHDACVAACGMAGGSDLPVTVFPFILRAVTLVGIDAAWGPIPLRHDIWARLAGPWKLDCLDRIARFVDISGLPAKISEILAGETMGRYAVSVGGEPS